MKGRAFGNYRITHQVGQGGMAQVWAARHEVTGGTVAVKILLPEMLKRSEDGMRRRLINEAVAMSQIKHAGIVQVFDLGIDEMDESVYIVMELLKGETLKARIAREGALPLAQTKGIIRQLARATGAAHKQGIIHRDLKPDNIFIVKDPEVQGGERIKVLDFGLAKLTEGAGTQITKQGAIFGTPSYMAPEQCEGAADVDHRADLYAIGCIFFLCLCGRPPFICDTYVQILMAQKNQKPTPPREIDRSIPVAVEALILRLMSKKPRERVQTSEQLLRLLDMADGAIPRPASESLTTSPYSASDEDSTVIDDRAEDGIEDLSDALDILDDDDDDDGDDDDGPTIVGGGMSLIQLPRGLPSSLPRIPLPGVSDEATLVEAGVGDVQKLLGYPSKAPTIPAEPKTVPETPRKRRARASSADAATVSAPMPRDLATNAPASAPSPYAATCVPAPSPFTPASPASARHAPASPARTSPARTSPAPVSPAPYAPPSPYASPPVSPYAAPYAASPPHGVAYATPGGPGMSQPVQNQWQRSASKSEPSLKAGAAEVIPIRRESGPGPMYRQPALPPVMPKPAYVKWAGVALGVVILIGLVALASHEGEVQQPARASQPDGEAGSEQPSPGKSVDVPALVPGSEQESGESQDAGSDTSSGTTAVEGSSGESAPSSAAPPADSSPDDTRGEDAARASETGEQVRSARDPPKGKAPRPRSRQRSGDSRPRSGKKPTAAEISKAYYKNRFAEATAMCRRLGKRIPGGLLSRCIIAACRAKNGRAARSMYKQVAPGAGSGARQTCERAGVRLTRSRSR